jgi:hypothetical protein
LIDRSLIGRILSALRAGLSKLNIAAALRKFSRVWQRPAMLKQPGAAKTHAEAAMNASK